MTLPRAIIGGALVLALHLSSASPARGGDAQGVSPEELSRRASGVPDRASLGVVVSVRGTQHASLMPWQPLGPAGVDGVHNPGEDETYVASGRVSAIAIDPRNGDVAYAAAAQGGVWKTTDGGATWRPLTDLLSSLSSGGLALDPGDPDIVYYGTGEQHFCGDCLYGDGLFRSTDGGTSWEKIGVTADVGSYVARVALTGGERAGVLVGSDRGVVRSTDAGATWQRTLSTGWCCDLALDPRTSDVVYAAVYDRGIYRSTDAGDTWTQLSNGLPTRFSRINLAIAPSEPDTLYASFVDIQTGGLLGLYRTGDAGATWTQLPGVPDYLVSVVGGLPSGQGWFDNCIVVDPSDGAQCYVGGAYPADHADALLRTTDGGATWTGIGRGVDGVPIHHDHQALAFGPDHRLWDANDGGIWTSVDGGLHWLDRNATLAVTQFYSVASHPSDPLVLVGGTQDQGTLALEGGVWTQRLPKDGGPCLLDSTAPLVFYGTTYAMSSLSYVKGDSVYDRTGPWVASGDRAAFATGPFVRDPSDPATLHLGTQRLWRSTDGGVSWSTESDDLTGGSWAYTQSLALCPTPPHAQYVGTVDGYLWVRTDDDPTWSLRTSGLPPAPLSAIAVDPADGMRAFVTANVTSGARVFATDDAGITWTSVSSDLPDGVRPISMAVSFGGETPVIHLGTDFGVYTSFDGGQHWDKTSLGLPSLAVYALSLDEVNQRLVAATHGRGMWSSPLPLSLRVGDGGGTPAVPGRMSLRVASPGIAGRVEIEYALPGTSDPALDIITTGGRLVAHVALGRQEAGAHHFAWTPRHTGGTILAAGLYLLRLRAQSEDAVARLVVLR